LTSTSADDVDLANLLERAEVDAQRRRHDTVDPLHLLSVILEEEAVERALSVRGLDSVEVREMLEATLTERPLMGGFRDVARGLSQSPDMERVLARLAAGASLFSFGQPMTVLDALLLDREVAKVIVALRQCNGARHVLERATAFAVVCGHSVINVAHVMKVLLDVPWFVEALERTPTTTTDALRAKTDGALMTIEPASEDNKHSKRAPAWISGLIDVLRTVPRHKLSTMTLEHFCVALTRESATRHALESLSIDPFALLYSIVHGEMLPSPELNLHVHGRLEEVILHKDDLTPQIFVRRVLGEAFSTASHETDDLIRVMVGQGQAFVGKFLTAEARERWKLAQTMCREEMYPLRLSVRKAT
jgi:ATP-dependent Clp protease adapter protein ClpS/ATP-dependent Clp protease ATP-binding subunit ClpA